MSLWVCLWVFFRAGAAPGRRAAAQPFPPVLESSRNFPVGFLLAHECRDPLGWSARLDPEHG